jgi:peptidoglycan/LPS O-acetylase OafA/YrhL
LSAGRDVAADNCSAADLFKMQSTKKNFESVESLRGIAALGVFLFHWSYLFQPGLLKDLAEWGRLGVEAFFVVSGFIIPYSLLHSKPGYNYRNFGRFILKRLVRLHPPYLTTIVLSLAVGRILHAAHPETNAASDLGLKSAIAHFFYANGVLGWPWLVSVFWTLGVEFQWYVLIALTYPLLVDSSRRVSGLTICLLAASVLWKPSVGVYVFQYLPLFAMGFTAFLYTMKRISPAQLGLAAVILFFAIMYTSQFGVKAAIVAACSAAFILGWKWSFWPVKQLGKISYSLYLVHGVVFFPLCKLVHRFGPNTDGYNFLSGLAAFILTLGFSHLFYFATERPSQMWSSRIRFVEPLAAPATADKLAVCEIAPVSAAD